MTPSWMRAPRPWCPTRTTPRARMQQPQRLVRTTEPTKPRASELFLSPLVQILIPYRSECTSARQDYGGEPEDALVPAAIEQHSAWAIAYGCLSGPHCIPLGLGNGVATSDHGEQRIDVIPQKEPYFLPPGRRVRH
jgi:hypothetical protein